MPTELRRIPADHQLKGKHMIHATKRFNLVRIFSKAIVLLAAAAAVHVFASDAPVGNKPVRLSPAESEQIAELKDIRVEYASAAPEEKLLLRSMALRRFAVYRNKLPSDLKDFYSQLEQEGKTQQ